MKRFFATFICDIKVQYRNGFYYAALVVTALAALLVYRFPAGAQGLWLNRLLPAIIVNNLLINTFYFVGGLVLLEKGEGTLEAQVVTPLRAGEYLGAKVGTLLLLSLLENLVLTWLVARGAFSTLPLVAGITLAAGFYTLAGFALVIRYAGMNEYLLPSLLLITLLALPLLPYFGVANFSWVKAVVYLHPLQPVLVLLQAAFHSAPSAHIAYGLVAGSLWAGGAAFLARRSYRRFVVEGI